MAQQQAIELDDNGNPVYDSLDDNGNPIKTDAKGRSGFSGAYGMPSLGDIWHGLTGWSVTGMKDPGAFTAETKDPDWLSKKLVYEATTPLALLGEGASLVGASRLFKGKPKVKIPEVLPPEVEPPRPIRGLLGEAPR